ncbi:MAG: hypothetical protein RBT87_07315 [bacterium]|jgi:hypothetical protein|nr:hypothetical protein [bacterium]
MPFLKSYNSEKKLESISRRLKFFSLDRIQYHSDDKWKIRADNLKYNLSLIIAKIIMKLQYLKRSKENFIEVIEEYNQKNNTSLSFEDFEKEGWIRIIAGQALIPIQVLHAVRDVCKKLEDSKDIEIPQKELHLSQCLNSYNKRFFKRDQITISHEELDQALIETKSDLNSEYFCKKGILMFEEERQCFIWNKNNFYCRELGAEIASAIWFLIGNQKPLDEKFKQFFEYIIISGISSVDMRKYLPQSDCQKICESAATFLINENDLINLGNEFKKLFLDFPSDYPLRKNINSSTFFVQFNSDDLFNTIESLFVYRWNFSNNWLVYEGTRKDYYSLLCLIIENESNYSNKYPEILSIFKDTSRPFLIWTLYETIPRNHIEVIPYLLSELELIPIAFRMIDEVGIDHFLLQDPNNDNRTEGYVFKNQIWLEMFEFVLNQIDLSDSRDEKIGNMLNMILLNAAEDTFRSKAISGVNIHYHNPLKDRYKKALNILANKRVEHGITSHPRIISNALPKLAKYVISKLDHPSPNRNEFLNLNSGLVDFSIEILKFLNICISESENSIQKKEELENSLIDMTRALKNYLTMFFCVEEITVTDLYSGVSKKEKAKRGVGGEFGYEILDWGHLFLHFQKLYLLKKLDAEFIDSLKFNTCEDKYNEENQEQHEKIKLYLKSLMIAYVSINKNRNFYESEQLPVTDALCELETLIKFYALKYSCYKLPNNRTDAFDERFRLPENNLYFLPLTTLLYRSANYFAEDKQIKFFKEFFANSIDIERMLKAINILDLKNVKEIISERIKEIKVADFIKSANWITELEQALIEAVNSEQYWAIAKPLIEEVQTHHIKRKTVDAHFNSFMFEIKLLLAYKEKDWGTLFNLEIPKSENIYPRNFSNENLKKFYIAIYKIYNDKNYTEGINMLKLLSESNPQDVKYSLNLYSAQILEANEKGLSKEIFIKANAEWEKFVENLKEEDEKKKLLDYSEAVDSNKLFYYVSTEDSVRFDQTISKLSKRYLYDEDLIPVIYKFYKKRDLHEFAYDYLTKSEHYLRELNKEISPTINDLIEKSKSEKLPGLKSSFNEIVNLIPKDIPSVTPDCINNKRNLAMFILNELILALVTLLKKRVAAKNILEDQYNDFIQAVLVPRFAIWGWSIPDQPRTGKSGGIKDAGNADLVLESGGKNFALIEALKFGGSKYTEKHILKCEKYDGTINRYYIIVYHLKKSENFDKNWEKYKKDVLRIEYPATFPIKKEEGFIDISNEFEDVRNFKIAKTLHGEGVEMFHIMINLGD